MRRPLLPALFAALAALIAWLIYPSAADEPQATPVQPAVATSAAAPFAVVELFTSEGCSSCPPADRLLARLADEAEATGERVFLLSFHVDYWNYLGWADPYSDAAFSDRQRDYARALEERTYTPQMIVNGQTVFVGSNEARARRAIASALRTPATASLTLSPTLDGRTLTVGVDGQVPAGAEVHLAVVAREVTQRVRRGENAGRTLPHAHVVRAFTSMPAGTETATLTLPRDADPANSLLIGYVQDPATRQILGAAQLALASEDA